MPDRFLKANIFLSILVLALWVAHPVCAQNQDENKNIETQKNILRQLSNIEKRIAKVHTEIKDIRKQNISLSSDIAKIQKEEKELSSKLEDHLKGFNEAARTVARIEKMPMQALSLSSDLRTAHMRQLAITQGRKSLDQQIDQKEDKLKELRALQLKREKSLAKIMQLEEKSDNRKKHLTKLFESQLKLLKLNNAEKAALVEEAHKMQEAKAMQDLLNLRKSATYKVSRVSENYGRLPTQGHITLKYNEKNDVGLESRGVTIAALAGAEVVALRDGRVIYNDEFRGYGQIIILEHEEGLHSLYSGALKSDLALGDFVRSGQKISTMPENENPKLYIELRRDGKAVNPNILLLAQK